MYKTTSTSDKQLLLSFSLLVLLLSAATAIGWLFREIGFPETNIVVVYIFSILLTARLTPGYSFGILAAISTTFIFNYFFTEPYFSFSVNDPSYFITFIIMTIIAIVTSALTSKAKQSTLLANEKETIALALYQLTSNLTHARSFDDLVKVAIFSISDVLKCNAAYLSFNDLGSPADTFVQLDPQHQLSVHKTKHIEQIKSNLSTLALPYIVNDSFYDFPLHGQETMLGVIRIPADEMQQIKTKEKDLELLTSMITSITLAMEHLRSIQKQLQSREEAAQERYRGNLLRAISHDLRTPLAGILGTAEMLMSMTNHQEVEHKLADDIYKEATWLHALVENILNLTRLQDGRLLLKKQPEAIEEVIGSVISIIGRRYPSYEIAVSIPDDVLVIAIDAHLIEQVLVNLLDNAIKHTADKNGIQVSVVKVETQQLVRFTVSDNGIGIKQDDVANIFEMFYTSAAIHPDAKHGIGLGLTICEAIVKAHGGTIYAQNKRNGSGAEFIFTLPLR